MSTLEQYLGRMCRHITRSGLDLDDVPYALVGKRLEEKLIKASMKHSVFHGYFLENGGSFLNQYCEGRSGVFGTKTSFFYPDQHDQFVNHYFIVIIIFPVNANSVVLFVCVEGLVS